MEHTHIHTHTYTHTIPSLGWWSDWTLPGEWWLYTHSTVRYFLEVNDCDLLCGCGCECNHYVEVESKHYLGSGYITIMYYVYISVCVCKLTHMKSHGLMRVDPM